MRTTAMNWRMMMRRLAVMVVTVGVTVGVTVVTVGVTVIDTRVRMWMVKMLMVKMSVSSAMVVFDAENPVVMADLRVSAEYPSSQQPTAGGEQQHSAENGQPGQDPVGSDRL